jgi:hypothetical protein
MNNDMLYKSATPMKMSKEIKPGTKKTKTGKNFPAFIDG